MAPHPAHFVHSGCALPLFCDSYTRNNKSTGHKNLRCFPHCCGAHRPNSFCGSSIVVECPVAWPTPATSIVSYCRFEASDMSDQAVIQVDQVVSVGNLTAEVKSTDVPLGTWMTGERLEMALGDSPPSILHFEFNRVRQSWHYGWRSNRFNCNIKHAFVVYVFEHHQGALRCLSRVMSPPFTICSTRRSGVVKPPLSPEPLGGAESDDDVKAEASPQRKRTRTTKSSTATSSSTDDDAVFLLPNHNEDDELMHTAVQEMLQLAEVYARSGTLNISATAPSTYAVLIDLLDTHVFTRTTLQFIQGCLEQGQVDLHRSFRQLLWLMWKQASEDLETRRQLTIGHVLGHIQQAFPWCDLTQGYYDPWFHHYTTLAAEVNKTTWRDSLKPVAHDARSSSKPIFGRWQRDTPVQHGQLIHQHLLEMGSRIWTCTGGSGGDTSTVQMQWECSVHAPWTAFRLDQLPQSHPHQLMGPCGLPTLGSGLHLCGTRAWEENQGDTLVVEWYFWPSQEDLPRKRVRERFTLLASTINSMMCQQFVELCWDNIHDIVVGPDVAQRVLLPANWQVHHIETYYYHRILAES
ncbi:hypothetical protein H257_03046 [Aphanomyces astaci]|uniref:Uncharacterized protein n=1 Tax=Aphanomyces astaci TaxID=112090 RepID=W4H1V2_APHAT|nr:hypothetical protein H257_03046 [Aphanomyces astaci]ETV85234.1 hypothetical protein H257_03046 [Aphanomyces astaci]|eukprot:XP_009825252.1 hypothetical protein H257_03046 [Aphanomyces astaci]